MRPLDDLTEEEWKQEIGRLLTQHHEDIKRLWKNEDTRPDDYVGRPPGAVGGFQTTSTTTP